MILQINKYHRVASGETASSEKIEKSTSKECNETAMQTYFQYLSNYMADSSVLEFAVTVYNPKECRVIDCKHFVKEEVQTEVIAE